MRSYGSIAPADKTDHATTSADASEPGSCSAISSPQLNGKPEADHHQDNDDDDDTHTIMSESSHGSAQAGVKRLEAISSSWSKSSLYVAYLGIALLAYATSLEGQVTSNLAIYATSAFKAHSLVSTVLVIQGVVLSVVKPPMAKIADVFGRFEAFSLCIVLYVIGYIQQAASTNVNTYATAQIFYAAGQTGLQILIQIFIADTSDLVNRALCSTIPALPYLVNVWVGPALADYVLVHLNWRWGFGIWAVVLPIAFLPLSLALLMSQRKAAMRGLLPKSPFAGESWRDILVTLWYELDFFGLVLISVAFGLILVPLTLASKAGWANPNVAVSLVIGTVCLFAIPFWERSKTLAPRAFFPRSFWRNKTLLAGLGLSFFYFSECDHPLFTTLSTTLTMHSGVLSLRVSLLPILPFGRTRHVGDASWSNSPDIHLHGDCHLGHHLLAHQIHETLQEIHGARNVSLHIWPCTHDVVPDRRIIAGYNHRDPSVPRDWW
jgi:MFS family permease